MNDGFVKTANKKILNVTKIVTILYLENSSSFVFSGESHDFWEFTYIDKGAMIFTADGREFLLNSGEMVFHKPNEFHKLEARGLSAPNISVVSFVCKSKAMEYFKNKIIKLSEKEKLLLSDLLKEGLSVFSPITERPPVYGMYEKQNAPLGAKQITFNLLEQFLITLSRRNDNVLHRELRNISPIDEGNYPAEIRDIIKFLDDNLSKNLTVKQIAEKFSISQSKLKKLFHNYARRGVIQCFNDRKIVKAKRLIRENNLNFTEIADILAFNSVHYFSRLFKIKTGMTPSEYKNSIK